MLYLRKKEWNRILYIMLSNMNKRKCCTTLTRNPFHIYLNICCLVCISVFKGISEWITAATKYLPLMLHSKVMLVEKSAVKGKRTTNMALFILVIHLPKSVITVLFPPAIVSSFLWYVWKYLKGNTCLKCFSPVLWF